MLAQCEIYSSSKAYSWGYLSSMVWGLGRRYVDEDADLYCEGHQTPLSCN